MVIKNLRFSLPTAVLMSFIVSSLHAATFVVTTTADNGNNGAPTAGSLRAAIVENNLTLGPNTINFAISGTAPFIIQPPVDLPPILEPVTINGYSQSGSAQNTATQGSNATILVVLDGTNAPSDGSTTGNGLHFIGGSSGSIAQGLAITNWKLNGVLIETITNAPSSNSIQILGNFIGTDSTGTVAAPNRTGIGIASSLSQPPITGTIIGNSSAANRNLINGSSNHSTADSFGIVGACICSANNEGTIINNNLIGTDRSGIKALGSSVAGITFIDETSSSIG